MKRLLITLFIVAAAAATVAARNRQSFDKGWRFALTDGDSLSLSAYDDSGWRQLDLPHDWAIEGDFSAGNPSGASGGALPGGVGWYRKHFRLSDLAQAADRYAIEFDGVYMNATVYINGHSLGTRPYGYSSFQYDLTPWLNPDGDNLLAVRVDNSDQPNSRWYSGCGIYRHVWLTSHANTHISHWGTHVVTDAKGSVTVSVEWKNENGTNEKPQFRHTISDASGRVVARSQGSKTTQRLKVKSPRLWSVEQPHIYKVKTELLVGGKTVDEEVTVTGFRSFRFDAETGFWLNGRNFKINGVCEHHDLGCLGAALNEDALHRKLLKLRAMGVNAVRCSHNPPAPELLNMCDTMGFIVMDESFDMWRRRKTKNDYARFFDEWHERDLTDLVLRDRNHPSILMWSIGNEVLEQWSSADADELTLEEANLILNAGHDASTLALSDSLSPNSLLTLHLADIVRRYDTTRPITAGCNEPDPKNHLFKSGAIDIIGFNYHHQWVKDVPQNFPGQPFLFTESVSALQSRGFYMMPSDSVYKAPVEWWLPYTDPSFQCSAYDNMHASWSSTHEETWDVVKHNAFVGGQFIWTGFDYIGEPTPYGFPAHSSYFGLIDLAGFPKDTYYMYQSEWTTTPVLHLFPHWNWLEGQQLDLWCYYNQADEVELFINGKSQGVRRKTVYGDAEAQAEAARLEAQGKKPQCTEYHVSWRVKFEPGEARVVARKNGSVVREQVVRTAGQPHHLRLLTDYQGRETTFVSVEVVDKDGNRCPWAENDVVFSTTDGAEILGVDNGNAASTERYQANHRRAFSGRCLVVLKGHGTLTARSIDLDGANLTF